MCNLFKLLIKWIFTIIGVPTLAYILLYASIQHTFETAKTFWQIIIGIGLIGCLIYYAIFLVLNLIEETKECFER